MKIKVLKKSEEELKIEIQGSSHGLCNLLQKRLLEDSDVDFAGYDVPHPLASNPVIYIKMKTGHKPKEALLEATEKVKKANNVFGKELELVLKV